MEDKNYVIKNVMLVEDDEVTRQYFTQAIADHDCLKVVASCSTLKQAIPKITSCRPDVLIIDLGLPDGSGIELIRIANAIDSSILSMVISVFSDERNTIEAIKAGASGYLLKEGNADNIAHEIMRLISGESPISPGIARHLLKSCRETPYAKSQPDVIDDTEIPRLTKREIEVLQCITKGYTYLEVADILGMSRNTVTSHIKHIYKKLKVHSRGEAVFEAMQAGIVVAPS